MPRGVRSIGAAIARPPARRHVERSARGRHLDARRLGFIDAVGRFYVRIGNHSDRSSPAGAADRAGFDSKRFRIHAMAGLRPGAARGARARGARGRTASLPQVRSKDRTSTPACSSWPGTTPSTGVAADIVFDVTNYSDVQPPRKPGWLVCNPPYDQRLKMAHVENLYRRLGRVLKHTWPGHQAVLLSGNLDAAVQIGLRPARRFRVFNGPIECRLLRFALYDGRRSDRDATEPVAEPTTPTESSPVVKLVLDGRPRDGTGQPFDAHGKALGQVGEAATSRRVPNLRSGHPRDSANDRFFCRASGHRRARAAASPQRHRAPPVAGTNESCRH